LILANVDDQGGIPVWLRRGTSSPGSEFPLRLFGEYCAAVEANVLMGLIRLDRGVNFRLIAGSFEALSVRIQSLGGAANRFYIKPYFLWMIAELLSELPPEIANGKLCSKVDWIKQWVCDQWEQTLGTVNDSLTHAACLRLVASTPIFKWAANPTGIDELLKRQQHDGSWPPGPLYSLPSLGNVPRWYTNRLVTSALCYRAIKRFAEWQGVVL